MFWMSNHIKKGLFHVKNYIGITISDYSNKWGFKSQIPLFFTWKYFIINDNLTI